MSATNQESPRVDLDVLTRPVAPIERPRRSVWRILLPLLIVLAFGALFATSLRDLFERAVPVTIVRPRPAESQVAEGAERPERVVLQAAGWVEPDPFPVAVTALAAGVVREVLVQESDVVAAGDPVVLLVDEDAQLALAAARGALERAQAAAKESEARARIARERFNAALEVTEARDAAAAMLDGAVAEAKLRAEAVREGEARVALAEDELVVQLELEEAGASGVRQVEIAESRVEETRAALAGLQAEAERASAGAETERARAERAARDFELRFADTLELETSAAAAERARAEVAVAQASLDEAVLRQERMTVRAPIDGVVIERLVTPGSTVGAGAMGAGSPVCTLFDPLSVRVRVDVPQGEIAKLGVGGRCLIETESRDTRSYEGEVVRVVSQADIQKVTLQAHVRVVDSDAFLRPEMLCQVQFFGGGASSAAGPSFVESLWVPEAVVRDGAVFVVDGESGRAARRAVTLGARADGEVEVLEGIDLSDKLIAVGDADAQALVDGARIRVQGGVQ